MRRLKAELAAVLFGAAILLNGCGLFPAEAEHNPSVLIADDRMEYVFACVSRGDLVRTETIVCAYVPAAKEDYSFEKADLLYTGIYVKAGDEVKQGDLLAELDNEAQKEALRAAQAEKERRMLILSYREKEQALQVEKQKLLWEAASKAERMTLETPEDVRLRYEVAKNEDTLALTLLETQIAELTAEIEAGRIYAGMDGVVTYTREITAESRSVSGSRVVTVSDISKAFFKATTLYKESFLEGMGGVVVVDKEEYRVTVVNPEDYGITPGNNEVYFAVEGDAFALEQGDKGTLALVLEKEENVLYLPSEAISSLGEKSVVFYLNEEGIRDYKEVITGAVINGYTEILEGVNEGEQVIIG